jgi:hypothetical protein
MRFVGIDWAYRRALGALRRGPRRDLHDQQLVRLRPAEVAAGLTGSLGVVLVERLILVGIGALSVLTSADWIDKAILAFYAAGRSSGG